MSQAKVDKYKEQKKNRDKIMKREKRERILAEVIVCVVVVALIGWAGYSFYQNHKPTVVNTYTVDGTALTDYMSEHRRSRVRERDCFRRDDRNCI